MRLAALDTAELFDAAVILHHFEWFLHLLSIDEIYLAGDKMRLAVRNAVGGLTA
jgi:hypothetical protein